MIDKASTIPTGTRALVAGLMLAVAPWGAVLLGLLGWLEERTLNALRQPRTLLLLIGAVLWLLPNLADGGQAAVISLAQMGVLVLVWLSSQRLSQELTAAPLAERTLLGTLFGLALFAVVSLGLLLFDQARIMGWTSHPNIWAAYVLVPTVAVASLAPRTSWRVLALALGTLTIVASGSRGAAVALLLAVLFLPSTWKGRAPLYLAVAVGLFAIVSIKVQPRFMAGIPAIVQEISDGLGIGTNLLQGPAQPLGVAIVGTGNGTDGRSFELSKTEAISWARLQYPLILFPRSSYTLSGEFGPEAPAGSGVLGIGSAPDRSRYSSKIVRQGEEWTSSSEGGLESALSSVTTADGWYRFEWTLVNRTDQLIRMWIGPSPSLAEGDVGNRLRFRNLQAEAGTKASPYSAPERLPLAAVQFLDRLRAFRVAWTGFLESPLVGNTSDSFATFYRHNPPDQRTVVPAHAHNLVLATLFERGILGFVGLGLILAAVISVNPLALLPVMIAVLASNTVDITLWSAQQLNAIVLLTAIVSRPTGSSVS